MRIDFNVIGIPKGQPRVRACIRGNRAGTFDPGTADDWKAMIASEGLKHLPASPLDGPVLLNVRFFFPRPKSHFNSKGLLKVSAPQYHTGKPDADNTAKAVMDILTQIGIWKDDSQVARLLAVKFYAKSFSGAEIAIENLPATQ